MTETPETPYEIWHMTYHNHDELQWQRVDSEVTIAYHDMMISNNRGGYGLFVPGTIRAVAFFWKAVGCNRGR